MGQDRFCVGLLGLTSRALLHTRFADGVWVQGHFLRARAGYYYNQPQWVQHGDRWAYRGGSWSRGDRDHDGIPNRHDRDRDGDGVSNRYDRAPDNPYRR